MPAVAEQSIRRYVAGDEDVVARAAVKCVDEVEVGVDSVVGVEAIEAAFAGGGDSADAEEPPAVRPRLESRRILPLYGVP